MDVREIWSDILSETDREVIQRSGFGKSRTLGQKPCVLVIDVQYIYAGEDAPILDQQLQWPFGCGDRAWRAAEKMSTLIAAAREIGAPILYSRHVQHKTNAYSSSVQKTDKHGEQNLEGSRGTMIVEELAPREQDIVIDKSYASVFYGTPIESYLVKLKVDTILLVGGSTSGCVRASAIDAVMRNWDVAVVADCVYDRIEASHKVGLFDMWLKYTNVIDQEAALKYLDGLRATAPARVP